MMKPWIENISWDDCKHGWHYDAGDNSMLIQIADPATFFPKAKHVFKETHQFEFLDADDSDIKTYGEEPLISDTQAETIVKLLEHALDKHMNIVVHCHAGICRSGAVVEVATIMGFRDTGRLRIPNIRVKNKMLKYLGLTYDANATYDNQAAYNRFVAHNKS